VRDEPAAAERAAAALQWYGGSLLPEATYEPWATAPRGRLHARYVQLLDLLAEHAERLDRLEDAARDLELAVEAEPHDPDRPVAAAAVRVRQGRRSRAATLCRLARQRADDLGVPPPAAVEHLESEARNAG
jgi:DNA-binding SARP family transcriptional activator